MSSPPPPSLSFLHDLTSWHDPAGLVPPICLSRFRSCGRTALSSPSTSARLTMTASTPVVCASSAFVSSRVSWSAPHRLLRQNRSLCLLNNMHLMQAHALRARQAPPCFILTPASVPAPFSYSPTRPHHPPGSRVVHKAAVLAGAAQGCLRVGVRGERIAQVGARERDALRIG